MHSRIWQGLGFGSGLRLGMVLVLGPDLFQNFANFMCTIPKLIVHHILQIVQIEESSATLT